jgi:hypothetical protein
MRYLLIVAVMSSIIGASVIACAQSTARIDRHAVVSRHNVVMRTFDPLSPISVGNGHFAFSVDPTGLQTFPEMYESGTPLCTMAEWGWHSFPLPAELKGQELKYTNFDTYGRPVPYMTSSRGQERLFNWRRENPHKFDLGKIAMELKHADGSAAKPEDLKNVEQTLDLWTGIITSKFEFDGQPVSVQTCCAGETDAVGAKIESPLISDGRLAVSISFPYGSPGMSGADWKHPESHQTKIERRSDRRAELLRTLDEMLYRVTCTWSDGANLDQVEPHQFVLRAVKTDLTTLEFASCFQVANVKPNGIVAPSCFDASEAFWKDFWSTGGAIDLSGSTDPRWNELERRIVLSQYLTRINCAGTLPPAETGLTCNSWYGKFHLEMHWWHDVHFALWNRLPLLERTLGYYQKILPQAKAIAQRQGYAGVRWPKMVGPDGLDSPSPIGPLLIWQQPHPIYYAELCYRAHPDRKTLEQWQEIVEQTADFMASYAHRDEQTGKYMLGPPLKTVPEHNDAKKTRNPTFELEYWRFGLKTAQAWRERLGQARKQEWDDLLKNLSPLPKKDGLYLSEEGLDDTYTNWNWEHPSLVGAMGVLDGDGVDPTVMRASVEKVMQVWQWDRCWGWDFPMTAMAAARCGRPDLAIDALMIQSVKNKWLPNGHVYQRENLPLYLPANGGFLTAVAMMAAGWDGAPKGVNAPGFPRDGWNVRWENLKRMP